MGRRRRGAGSESAGYHYDATPKRPQRTRTPVKAPSRREAAKAPAGDYAGARQDFAAAVGSLPSPARAVTAEAVVLDRMQRRARRAAGRQERRERQRTAAAIASVSDNRRRRQARRYEPDPAKAVISSRPNPLAEPDKFAGKATAGTPTRGELQRAQREGTLKVNRKGFVTTPAVRSAARGLKQARATVRQTQPSVAGLSPEERAILPYARRAHRKFPDIPVSVLMAQDKQESGFDPLAVSSAGAFGVSQFIPSTAASYGVKRGSSRSAIQSQVTGQAHLLHDQGFATDPQGALSAYSGGYAAGDYNNPILTDAKSSYSGLDKPGSPKALKRLRGAQAKARQVGLKVPGSSPPAAPPPAKLVKRVVVAEQAMKEIEGKPYVWGGGHGSFRSWGYDCSGAVSYVVHKVAPNLLKAPVASTGFGSIGLKPGPGALTVYYNFSHAFLSYVNRHGETIYWGTSVGDSGEGGLTRHPAPSKEYLAQYHVGHVPGMGRKQALQLGAEAGGGGSSLASTFPGLTFSQGGTTATITPGSGGAPGGVVKKKPGFSRKPIRLSGLQVYNRNKRKLRALGVPLGGQKDKQPETHPVLQELIEKYGSANPVPTTAAERKAKALAAATP